MRTFDIDVDDDDAFSAWFAPIEASDRFMGPDASVWLDVELRALGRTRRSSRRLLSAVADDDGAVVGASLTSFPLLENTSLAEADTLCVLPERRREGFGSALLDHVCARVTAAGRTRLQAPVESGLDDDGGPGDHFARARGFSHALSSSKRRIALPADLETLGRLEVEGAALATDYDVVTWTGRCPDRLLDGRLELAMGMSTDTPQGDLQSDTVRWDEARLREFEDITVEMQRTMRSAGAVHRASGELVAFSDIAISTIAPQTGYQYDTIVLGAHRGHRLGTLVKAANLRQVMADSPATRELHTWNADANAPMIRVNEALGFTLAAHGGFWQRELG